MKLTKKQLAKWNAFQWRVRNTFKSIVLPVALPFILAELTDNPNSFAGFVDKELWVKLAWIIAVALVGSAVAGLDKVKRMQ